MAIRRRGGGERGATLVEAAFVVPIVILLVFGTIEFGFAFNNANQLRQGVREGARQGVVSNYGPTSVCSDLVGAPTDTETRRLMCLVKDRIGISPMQDVRVSIRFNTSYTVGQGLVVCAQYPLDSLTGMFDPFLNGEQKSKVEMRLEQAPAGGLVAGSETPPTGGDWTWC